MAKLLFTAFLADARGKVNGTVFSKNRGGAYARTKVTPTQVVPAYTFFATQRLSVLSGNFKALPAAAISAWDAAAINFPVTNIFGNSYFLTGLQLYVSLNSTLIFIGESTISLPPLPLVLSSFTITIGTWSSIDLVISLSAINPNQLYLVEATRPLSPGKNFLKNEYRTIQTIDGTGAPIVNESILPFYTAKFGVPTPGQRIGIRIKTATYTTGQLGVPINTSQIVS